ncbi:multidrug ABC transporter ATPase [Phytohabitans rumicis]|uniref:Multidrug ABC transporter ATPase n=2 Tax=Phytohabitans rumicis TaxID=1076125 RepID=A0A6V8L7H7_9ACTN|nr:multidrug ABC transporter ATPase [Phytohabitans rumicis]
MGTAAIEIGDLVKCYGPVRAVDGITVRVAAGEIYALLGLNGAGKTTTIRVLLGMIAPTTGTVHLLGRPLRGADASIWAEVGFLVETPAAYPELTVVQNLRVAARLRHLPGHNHADEVIDRLGLAPYANRRARTLSLGNQQRLGLAKALIHRPRVLILDEPANGLDPAGVVEIRHLLQHLAAEGTTVLLSSHILAEVARLATRIGVIHQGRMITELATTELTTRIQQRLAVASRDLAGAAHALRVAGHHPIIDSDGAHLHVTDRRALEQPDQIATLLVHAGHPPTRLDIEQEDLEAYFLRLVHQQDPAQQEEIGR